MEKGQKFSGDKLPMFKVLVKQFPRAFQEVARNSNAGHRKYLQTDSNWDNWKHVEGGKETYLDAALRHLIQSENGVWDKDTEQYGGTRHLSAVAWNVLAALELDLIAEENSRQYYKEEDKLVKVGENHYENPNGGDYNWEYKQQAEPEINETPSKPHKPWFKPVDRRISYGPGVLNKNLTEIKDVEYLHFKKDDFDSKGGEYPR